MHFCSFCKDFIYILVSRMLFISYLFMYFTHIFVLKLFPFVQNKSDTSVFLQLWYFC